MMVDFKVIHFECIDSTQREARRRKEAGTLLVAKEQTKGKGRFSRVWHSSAGGLYFTLTLAAPSKGIHLMPLFVSVVLHNTLTSLTGVTCSIKWPNDILIEGKKVAGILSETSLSSDEGLVYIGVGVNTNNTLPRNLQNTSITFRTLLGRSLSNTQVLRSFLNHFRSSYKNFLNIRAWMPYYRNQCSTLGEIITVKTGKTKHTGKVVGLTSEGFLILLQRGKRKIIADGTILV